MYTGERLNSKVMSDLQSTKNLLFDNGLLMCKVHWDRGYGLMHDVCILVKNILLWS